MNNWKESELEHILHLWDDRPHTGMHHDKQIWNKRAGGWENGLRTDKVRQKRSSRRVTSTAEYLIEKGALTPETELIDIGCGPGRFVAEFAKTAKHATGLDLSDSMTGFGADFANENGLNNTSFINADFLTLDIDEAGLRGKYDLVFSSITPAMAYKESVEKGIAMSKKWFYNSCFVSRTDSLLDPLGEKLGLPAAKRDTAVGFYCMFNQLFLKGLFPEVTYFHEDEDEEITDLDSAAEEYFDKYFSCEKTAENLGKIKNTLESFADKDSIVRRRREIVYAWLLVDVTAAK